MNTKGSGPNDFRHSDDLSELIKSMKNDALEQAKKETEQAKKEREKEVYEDAKVH
jgi:hypothetical protein